MDVQFIGRKSMNARSELLEHLARIAYKFSPEKKFLLASGAYSDEYLDCKLALSHPPALKALGQVLLERLEDSVVAIGGLTMGSDPLAMSTCLASEGTSRPIRWFTVRKEAKEHGQKKLIEGFVEPGEWVAVVDDVVTSGKSTIKAIRACREFGLKIAQVTVLVDREQMDGMDNIRAAAGADVRVSAVFTKSQIKARWGEINQTQATFRATA
jgi:orotate phosphoribosyltransferase